MMKTFLDLYLVLLTTFLVLNNGFAAEQNNKVKLTLETDKVLNTIDPRVYGHFLEHIYHSCDGGLWGELVWNRSFEENEAGRWKWRKSGVIAQEGMGTNIRLVFGDASWTDYDYTLEARKTGGSEGFLVLFRVQNEKDFYWCNLGGWQNQRHAIERGVSERGRWGVVGPEKRDSIRTDHWYTIRVKCVGLHFTVWLDGEKVIDFTDDDRGHRSGAVGIGTWSTRAQFRNLKVASLDGKVLFEGVPKELTQAQAARHWGSYGDGGVFIDSDDAFNCDHCQRIVGGTKETGLRQSPFCIEKGPQYCGSLYVRGKAPEGLVVRLRKGEHVLDAAELKAPSQSWEKRCFLFTSKLDAPDAILEIGVKGGGTVWFDQVSLMPAHWVEEGGFRPDLLQAVKDLKPPIIRWPGGCFASAYRWKQGIGPQYKRVVHPRDIWDQQDVYSFGTDEFVAMCRKVGAEPLIVVNIGTPSWVGPGREDAFLQELLDWIEYCNGAADTKWGAVRAKNGHPQPYNVTYWEIDNETWHMGSDAYAEAVLRVAKAMRKKDPSIELAACGSASWDLEWNRVIIQRCAHLIDYLSIHHYENPNAYRQGPRRYEDFFHKTNEIIKKSKNPALKIYVSEWNAQSTDWRTGLYCGGLLNAFERCGEFLHIGGPALFLRHRSAAAWDNAFINFDHKGWFPAPNYVIMKLWRDHYAESRIALKGSCGGLNAVATKASDGSRVVFKVVNPTAEAVSVELELPQDEAVAAASMKQVAPDSLRARNSLDAPHAVRSVEKPVRRTKKGVSFSLPALSASVVEVKLKT